MTNNLPLMLKKALLLQNEWFQICISMAIFVSGLCFSQTLYLRNFMCLQKPIITTGKYECMYVMMISDCWDRKNEYKTSILVPFAVQFVKKKIIQPAKKCWICKCVPQPIVHMWSSLFEYKLDFYLLNEWLSRDLKLISNQIPYK